MMSSKKHERSEAAERHPAEPADARVESQAAQTSGPEPEPRTEAAPAASRGADDETKALRDKLAAAEARVKDLSEETASLKDQYLRKLADYENFRKRMFREKEEAQKFAVGGLLSDLVPVLDDFGRAIASSEHARDYQILHDGIGLIKKQLLSLLENKYGLVRYESVGKSFDPNLHEAVATVPGNAAEAEPTVQDEYLPGYRLHDRVIRTAKVIVRMPAAPQAAPQSGQGASTGDAEAAQGGARAAGASSSS